MITINNKPLHIEKEEGYTYLEAPVDKEKDTIIVLDYKTQEDLDHLTIYAFKHKMQTNKSVHCIVQGLTGSTEELITTLPNDWNYILTSTCTTQTFEKFKQHTRGYVRKTSIPTQELLETLVKELHTNKN